MKHAPQGEGEQAAHQRNSPGWGQRCPETVPSALTSLSSSKRFPRTTGWRGLHTHGQGAVEWPGQQGSLDRGPEAAQPCDETLSPQCAFSSSHPGAVSLADLRAREGGFLGSSLGGTGRFFLEGGVLSPSTGRHERQQRPEQKEAAGQIGKVQALTTPSRSSMPPGDLGKQVRKWPGGLGELEGAVLGDSGAGLQGRTGTRTLQGQENGTWAPALGPI